MGDPDPEESVGEGDGHLPPPPPHVLGYGSVGRGSIQRSSNSNRVRGRTPAYFVVCAYPSASAPRMHDGIRASGAGAQAVQVAPGLLGVRTPVMVSRSVPGVSSSRCLDTKSTTSTTSSGSANEVDIDIDIDIDIDDVDDEDLLSNSDLRCQRQRQR